MQGFGYLTLGVIKIKTLILAGGKGTRLYPMTLFMPKQLIMINGHPMIHYIIKHCKNSGIDEFVLCISNNSFKGHFYSALGDGSSLGVKLCYSVAPQSTETSGRILQAKQFVGDDDFVVYYGDIITNFNLKSIIEFHRRKVSHDKCICTLAMSDLMPLEFGVGQEDEKTSRIIHFKEKPKISEITDFKVNVGIAVCSPRIIDYCQRDKDLFNDVIPLLLENGECVCSYTIDKPFLDIGTFSNIEKALKMCKG